MKLSTKDKDFPSEKHINSIIYFNGIEIEGAIEASEEDGYVITHSKDKDGNALPNERGDLETEKFYGKVEIKYEPLVEARVSKQKTQEIQMQVQQTILPSQSHKE